MGQSPERVVVAKKSQLSDGKNMTQSWFHVWKWRCPDFPNASVILIQASNEVANRMNAAAPVGCPESLIAAVQKMPGFTGMAYVMRDRQDLSNLKVGKAHNAFSRMKTSPWFLELGRICHADRSEEMVIACINVPASAVEARLHNELGLPDLVKGCGREWFRAELPDLVGAFQRLTMDEGHKIWLEHDAISKAEAENVRSAILLNTADAPKSFMEIGEINYVCQRPDGFDVVSSIWCPVQFYVAENNIAMPFYALPRAMAHAGLTAELRSFGVDDFDAEPDIVLEDNMLVSGNKFQRIHRIRRIGSIVLGHDPLLDVTCDEWEIGGEIYEIDYRAKVDLLERFRRNGAGKFYREGCEHIF